MHAIARWLAATSSALLLAAVPGAVLAQSPAPAKPVERPLTKPVRSIPYVSITGEDGKQRHYETNAIPLLFHRACFGWRMYLGGPNRVVYAELNRPRHVRHREAGPSSGRKTEE